jgi:predicted phage terminase large subunit-like protein
MPEELYFRQAAQLAVKEEDAAQEEDWTASPAHLAEHVSGGTWEARRHLTFLSDKIAQVAVKPTFLIINLPPRHGKSELVSHWTPVWFLKRFPWKKVGLASYEMGFASEWGGAAKDTIVEHSDELNLELTSDTKAKGRWKLKGYGGGMTVAGIGGPLTGRGFDLIVIDDPIKNDQEALSPTYRKRLWNWYKTTLRTRLEPGGSIIVVLTRWHEADLAGQLTTVQEDEPDDPSARDPWEIINLPAVAEKNDPLGRQEGEPLWPERFDAAALANLRQVEGPFWWAALYQGRPQPEGGGIIKQAWFKYYQDADLPRNDKGVLKMPRLIQIWDTAFKENQAADRSACLTLATGTLGFYVMDLYVRRLEYPDLVRMAMAQADKWNPDSIYIEDKASGQSLIQQLKRDTRLPIRIVKAEDDKVTRAHSVTGTIEAGRVLLPARAPWLADFLAEVSSFPTGPHDDIPDVLVHGLRVLKAARLISGGNVPVGEHKTSAWRD